MISREKIQSIEICKILVANPRERDEFIHNEIKENIYQIGLKRPITVRRICHEEFEYALICGQGRLEAFRQYGESHIPAIVKEVDEETGHLMSLAENIARRPPRATELLESVRQLKDQGLSDRSIGERLGYSTNWVNNITHLLSKGECKLLTAFEAGHIPLYLAVEISRSDDNEIQNTLTEALMSGKIKGRQINIIKRIIERRKQGAKGSSNNVFVRNSKQKRYTAEELAELFQKNASEHKDIQLKAKYVRETLSVAKEIFKKLLLNEDFCVLLRRNNITDIPEMLSNQINTGDKHHD
ncbi:MAG: ParB N-terminal domain-containing protein [Citrobacter amalonaticus]|jgi:ParB family chromosome partitioning protein|nr:ParB N-terminal domain-containing protein [Citrobacter amalonaticus]